MRKSSFRKSSWDILTTAGALLILVSNLYAAQPSFVGLGHLGGTVLYGDACDVSGDGSIVIGVSNSDIGNQPFIWKPGEGMSGLGYVEVNTYWAGTTHISTDGQVIVTHEHISTTDMRALVQTGPGQWSELGYLDPTKPANYATGLSGDGSIIVGNSLRTGGFEGFRWTSSDGMTALATPDGHKGSIALGISADGSIIVGECSPDNVSGRRAYYWNPDGQPVALGTPPGIYDSAYANAASNDGSVIVGSAVTYPNHTYEAFRWTEAGGYELLGTLSGYETTASDVSGDGSIVVGNSIGFGPTFIWDKYNGMRDLELVLESEYGLDLTGWTLTHVNSISDDGKTIVGSGRNLSGETEPWVATIPEPTSLSLLAFLALSGLVLWRRR